MPASSIVEMVLETWKINCDINLLLIDAIPPKGFGATPTGSRGRDVLEQLVHMHRVRYGWLFYHRTGRRTKLPPGEKGRRPSRAELRKSFRDSGAEVGALVREVLEGRATVRAFRGNAVRWLGYLISHESHHRGSIALALKQNGLRLPAEVALNGLWHRWMW